jgi:hypothetical protein
MILRPLNPVRIRTPCFYWIHSDIFKFLPLRMPKIFPTQMLYAFTVSLGRATGPPHHSLLDLICHVEYWTVFVEERKGISALQYPHIQNVISVCYHLVCK